MTQITLQIDLTQETVSRIAKTLRQLAYQQRYPNDEKDLTICAKVFEDIATSLFNVGQEKLNQAQIKAKDK